MNDFPMNLLIVYAILGLGVGLLLLVVSWIGRGRHIRHLEEVIANRDMAIRAKSYELDILRRQQMNMMRHHD